METNEGGMKVEIPEMSSSPKGLTRQRSNASAKAISSCLCSPTTHAGSFRCRLHRSPSLQRTKSVDPSAFSKPDATDNTSNY
ncbi:hypothetical protein BVRB_6g148430 [Beta vulgaris subsp. vulgaris]|nr:hypothetical protein BVRB_6g148430 [Beta vulgaris subsp. vulgaris]